MVFEAKFVRSVRLLRDEARDGDVPAAVEYKRKHGCGYLPLRASLDEAFCAQYSPAGLKFLQQDDGSWRAHVYGAEGAREEWDLAAETVDAVLAASGVTNPIHAPEFIASAEQAEEAGVPWETE